MKTSNGYIYIRNHKSYLTTCKLGKTECLPNRDNLYATGELERGYFYPVFEVLLNQMNIIEKLLQYEFKKYNVIFDGGIEFYNKKIISLIEPLK
jgi:hypothetical protein